MNPFHDFIYKHKSIHRYKNKPLEEEKLKSIIKAVQAGPNWCDGQQLSIIAIKNQSMKEKSKNYVIIKIHFNMFSIFNILY